VGGECQSEAWTNFLYARFPAVFIGSIDKHAVLFIIR
jgi:hypothetical protein